MIEMLDVLLIGFLGVLFILVSYMIEGGLFCNYYNMKVFMYVELKVWFVLMDKLVDMVIIYLKV